MVGKNMKIEEIILHHINCQNPKCSVCLLDADKLGKYLDEQTGTGNRVDHLGTYHKWLMDNGIKPETEFGWFTSDAFDDKNIQNYVVWYLNHQEDGDSYEK